MVGLRSKQGVPDIMAPLRTDSPLSQRIVLSFLRFLNSVEVAPGADAEGLEVAAQCLSDVFQLEGLHSDQSIRIPCLPQLFASGGPDANGAAAVAADEENSRAAVSRIGPAAIGGDAPASNIQPLIHEDTLSNGQVSIEGVAPSAATSLFEQFAEGLENAGHFDGLEKGGSEYMSRMRNARITLEGVLKTQTNATSTTQASDVHKMEVQAVAEAYKIQGNTAMAAKRYHEAIELYTLAISLCSNNAIYFANRAAAHTHIGRFEEAIGDCKAAIKLNPAYSKAYSRLGTAYFAQGRFKEAIESGFQKALELEPTNAFVRSSLQAAQSRLNDEEMLQQRRQQQHASSSGQHPLSFNGSATAFGGSLPGFNGVPGPGGAMPNLPSEMSNFFPGLLNFATQFRGEELNELRRTAAASAGTHVPTGEGAGANAYPAGPGASQSNMDPHVDGDIHLTFEGGPAPPQLNALVHSMMQWLGGPHPQSGNASAGGDGVPGASGRASESQ